MIHGSKGKPHHTGKPGPLSRVLTACLGILKQQINIKFKNV